MRILIAIPLYVGQDRIALGPYSNMLLYTQRVYSNALIHVEATDRKIVWQARETLRRKAIRFNADYLVFLGEDMIFPENALATLINDNLPVVAALYFQRTFPYHPMFFFRDPGGGYRYEERDLNQRFIEVDGCGLDCSVIRKEVFASLSDRCFEPITHMPGEDLVFCEEVRRAGYKIYVDTKVEALHVSNNRQLVSRKTYDETKLRLRQQTEGRLHKP